MKQLDGFDESRKFQFSISSTSRIILRLNVMEAKMTFGIVFKAFKSDMDLSNM
jgi:hypothetical protein